MITNLYYPNIGGVEIATENLIKQFLRKGHSVELVTSRYPTTLSKIEYIHGVRVMRLPFRLPSANPLYLCKFFIHSFVCIANLYRLVKQYKFDLINLHYVSENALYALILSKFKNLPLVTSIHGADIQDFPFRNALNKCLVGLTLKKSLGIISNSTALLREATRIFGEELISKSVVCGNGIELSEFKNLVGNHDNLSPFILGIGRLVYKKGFDILLEAFSIVIKRFPHVKLVVIGDGVEKNALETLIRNLGLERSIIFCGNLEHENIPKYLASCEFFVLPSREEPFGIVNLEAMSAKKAVIAMDVGGVSDYLNHGKNGLLVKVCSPASLAEAIIYLLEHPDLAKQYGLNGRQTVENQYTWDTIADKYLDVFQTVL